MNTEKEMKMLAAEMTRVRTVVKTIAALEAMGQLRGPLFSEELDAAVRRLPPETASLVHASVDMLVRGSAIEEAQRKAQEELAGR